MVCIGIQRIYFSKSLTSDDLDVPFNCSTKTDVGREFVEKFRFTAKERVNFLYCGQDILEMFLGIIHKSAA